MTLFFEIMTLMREHFFLFSEMFFHFFDGKISQSYADDQGYDPANDDENVEHEINTDASEKQINDLTEQPEIDCGKNNKQKVFHQYPTFSLILS